MAFIRLSRLHFLGGGVLMFGVGAFVAEGRLTITRFATAQLMVTAAQITAQYVNEYADYDVDLHITNRTAFSGGSGVLGSGALHREGVLKAAYATSAVCLLACLATATFSIGAAMIGVLGLSVSWAYSMPPVRLLNTGFGELAAAATVGVLAPATGALAHNVSFPRSLWWIMAVLFATQLATLLAFELPDYESDLAAGKRVIVVRIGVNKTICLIVSAFVAAVSVATFAAVSNRMPVRIALGASIAVAPAIATLVAARSRRHQLTTFCAIATFAICGTGMLVASI